MIPAFESALMSVGFGEDVEALGGICGNDVMVAFRIASPDARVRFPLPAPVQYGPEAPWTVDVSAHRKTRSCLALALDANFSQVWCNGSMASFQVARESSSLSTCSEEQ